MFLEILQNSQDNTCARVSFLIKLKRLWHWCFPVNFAKFLRTPLQNTSGRLLLCQTENKQKFSCFENIFGKTLKSLILNVDFESWNYCIPRRHRLLGQTAKQPLSNIETVKPWKYKQFEGLRLTLVVYK